MGKAGLWLALLRLLLICPQISPGSWSWLSLSLQPRPACPMTKVANHTAMASSWFSFDAIWSEPYPQDWDHFYNSQTLPRHCTSFPGTSGSPYFCTNSKTSQMAELCKSGSPWSVQIRTVRTCPYCLSLSLHTRPFAPKYTSKSLLDLALTLHIHHDTSGHLALSFAQAPTQLNTFSFSISSLQVNTPPQAWL